MMNNRKDSFDLINVSKRLKNVLVLKYNYGKFAGDDKFILVEGSTDKEFVDNNPYTEIKCITAGTFQQYFENFHSKNFIIYSLKSMMPEYSVLSAFNDDNLKLFGMIDLDCDDETENANIKNIFITDTHDLETLILSTDKDVLNRLDRTVSFATFKKSLYKAYQIALLGELVHKVTNELKIGCLSNSTFDFSEFINLERIPLNLFIKVLNDHQEEKLSNSKIKKIYDKCTEESMYKKKYLNDVLNVEEKDFDYESIVDFWQEVNGHVIFNLIKTLDESIAKVYPNDGSLNRKFEVDVINHYDYKCFKSTNIAKKMVEKEVINF